MERNDSPSSTFHSISYREPRAMLNSTMSRLINKMSKLKINQVKR